MNYEEFKEQMVDAVKQELENRGIEAKVDTQTVEKMNEKYESIQWKDLVSCFMLIRLQCPIISTVGHCRR